MERRRWFCDLLLVAASDPWAESCETQGERSEGERRQRRRHVERRLCSRWCGAGGEARSDDRIAPSEQVATL